MKENDLSRVGDITGRRVDFTNKLPLAWGIEIELPFDSIEKSRLYNKYKIKIPEHIDTFKFLDLNPQESLPKKLRNISANPEYENDERSLHALVASERISKRAQLNRRRTMEDLFFYVFGWNEEEKDKFNSILAKCRGNTILVVEGHSWDAPWKIGEFDNFGPDDPEARKFQKGGNKVPVREILKRYNDQDEYAAILLFACYNGEKKVKAIDVPFAYGLGVVGRGRSLYGLLPTVIVEPRQRRKN